MNEKQYVSRHFIAKISAAEQLSCVENPLVRSWLALLHSQKCGYFLWDKIFVAIHSFLTKITELP